MAVANEIQASGKRCEICQCDVADPAQIDALFTAFDNDFKQLDALINNASIVDVAARVEIGRAHV